jgi:O-antigen/teichoic acid export membrane protein
VRPDTDWNITVSTIFQKYAAALLPFFILVVGASQTVLKFGQEPDWNAIITFAIVVLGAVLTFIVKLVAARWQGALKTGIAILTTILSALLPFVLPGGFDPAANVPVIIVAVLNALATEFGVQIRTGDNAISGGIVRDVDSEPTHLAA